MLNNITIMGRLVADPDLRYTKEQKAVVNFALAVDRDYTGGNERKTDFVPCTAWNQGAEFISQYFSKGRMMAVNGRLQSKKWEDRDGNKRTDWEVVVDNVYFCADKEN